MSENPNKGRAKVGAEDENPVRVMLMLPPTSETIDVEANVTTIDESVPAVELLTFTETPNNDDSNAFITVSVDESRTAPDESLVAEYTDRRDGRDCGLFTTPITRKETGMLEEIDVETNTVVRTPPTRGGGCPFGKSN